MSVWESQPNWDVVSIPNGAPAAKKAIQHNYEWVNYYDKIVIFFDNDDAGRGRCKRVRWGVTTWQGLHRLSRRLQRCLRGFTGRRYRGYPSRM